MFKIVVLSLIGLAASQCPWNALESTDKHTAKSTSAEKRTCMQAGVEGAKENCAFVVKCQSGTDYNPGYYFQDDPKGDGMEVTCRSKKWILKGTTDPVPSCLRGCTALSSRMMENATYMTGPPRQVFYNGNEVLWPANTVIETTCKPGFYFSDSATHQAAKKDSHKCTPGVSSGWLDQNPDSQHVSMAWPAYCRGYCDPFSASSLPAGVQIVTDPTTFFNDTDNGKPVIRTGAQYVFRCQNGYKPKKAAYKDGKQTLTCEGKWRDLTTGQQPASVLECISDGCPSINAGNLPTNGVVEEGTGCAGESKPNGCKVNVKCSKSAGSGSSLGYYMQGKPTGYTLICNKSSWIDESGAVVTSGSNGKFPGTCIVGCVGLTQTETIWTEVILNATVPGISNDQVIIYPIGSQISTSCKDGYVRPGLLIQGAVVFTCQDIIGWKISIDDLIGKGIYPGTCVPACEVTTSTGTKNTVGGDVYTKNGAQWVQKGATMTRVCLENYGPATGQINPQSLVCEGGSAGWKNSADNKTNVVPLQCVPEGAAGCVEVPVGSGVNFTTTGNCTKVDGLYPKDCVISIRCNGGYFPDGIFTISATGWQNLSCKAGKEGYVDVVTGQSNSSMLKCILACEYPDTFDGATYVTPAAGTAFFAGTYAGKRYIKPGSEVVTTCKSLDQGYYWNNEPDKNRVEAEHLINFPHVCKGGNDKYQKTVTTQRYGIMPGDMCGPTCEALSSTTTTFIIDQMKPDSIQFTTNYVNYVVNVLYRVVCAAGYQFPAGSPEATRNYQDLQCVGGGRVYQDLGTQTYNAKPTMCQKAPEPRCPAIDQTAQKTNYITVSGDCTPSSGSIAVDCVLKLTCQAGFFPISTYTGAIATSTLRCKKLDNGTAVWVDSVTQVVTSPMTCVPGCPVQELGGRAQILQDAARVTIAGIQYYPPDSLVAVSCLPVYIPASDSAYTMTTARLTFKCTAMDVTKPWLNTVSNTNERGPFMVCVKPCTALNIVPEGTRKFRGPREFADMNTQPPSIIVAGGGTYVFNCAPGYQYKPNRTNNEQQLVCDGDSGTYWDIQPGSDNQTQVTIQPCQKDQGAGCKDITPQNGRLEHQCQPTFPAGCSVAAYCNDGYAPTNPRYNITGRQDLTCKDGYNWTDSTGAIVTTPMECGPACKVQVDMHSTQKSTTGITIVVGNKVYIPAGGEVVVQCQGDGVVWIQNTQETTVEHRYKCIGGSGNYTLVGGDGSSTVLPGEGCVSTCVVFGNPSDDTIVITPPTTVTYQGKTLVANGLRYTVKCASGFKAATGQSSTQQIKCNGETRKYVDAVTNVAVEVARSCVRDSLNDECPVLKYNETAVEQWTAGCTGSYPGFVNAGCKQSYRCRPGYRPTTTQYNTVLGYRNVTCQNMGEGWLDDIYQTKLVGLIALECIPGCFNDTTSTTKPPMAQTGYYGPNNLLASCWDTKGYNKSAYSQMNYYSCPVPPTYYNTWCQGACRELMKPYPSGVIAVQSASPLVKDSMVLDYVFATTSYKFQCANGYSLPADSPWKSAIGQELMCNSDSTYLDKTLNKANSTQIMTCTQNVGCTDLPKSSNLVTDPILDGSCARPTATSYPLLCSLKYGCAQNSYPREMSYVYSGFQRVQCGLTTADKWTITNGPTANQIATTTLECVSGCLSINMTTLSQLFTSLSIEVKLENFPSTNGINEQLSCISVASRNNITTILSQLSSSSSSYFCPDSKDNSGKLSFDNKKNCPDTCIGLSIPSSGVQVQKPATFKPYGADEYVKTGAAYTFSCPSGQEFQVPAGSTPPATIQYSCQTDGTFRNPANNVAYNNPPVCVPTQQCTRPSATSPVEISYDPNKCKYTPPAAEKGCVLTATCANGSYPTDSRNLNQSTFPYECTTGTLGPGWRNSSNPQATFDLQCTAGCQNVANYASSQQISNKQLSVNGINCSILAGYVSNIANDAKRYFCEYQSTGISTKIGMYSCIGGCAMSWPPGIRMTYTLSAKGKVTTEALLYTAPTLNFEFTGALEYPGNTATFTCPNGLKFADTQTTTRTFVCNGNDFYFKENGQKMSDLGYCI